METLKGLARRTTQSLREMVSGGETSPEEAKIAEVTAKVKTMEAKGEIICQKVIQAARLMEDLGTTLKELGEEYKGVPDLPKESRDLAEDVYIVGMKLMETSQEHQKGLKDNGFELLRSFSKQCAQLREVEDTRRHHQLEYDFFKSKVHDLRASPQKDFTRLPRNEQILESWRVELWRITERTKAMVSQLYVDGRRAADRSVLTTVQVLHSFVEIASSGFAQTFQGVRLPSYPIAPVLPPTALPATPTPANGASGNGAPPGQSSFGSYGGSYAPPNVHDVNAISVTGAAGGGVPSSGGGGGVGGPYASTPPSWAAAAQAPAHPVAPASPAASAGSVHGSGSPTAYGGNSPMASGGGYQPPPLDPAAVQRDTSNSYQPPNV